MDMEECQEVDGLLFHGHVYSDTHEEMRNVACEVCDRWRNDGCPDGWLWCLEDPNGNDRELTAAEEEMTSSTQPRTFEYPFDYPSYVEALELLSRKRQRDQDKMYGRWHSPGCLNNPVNQQSQLNNRWKNRKLRLIDSTNLNK